MTVQTFYLWLAAGLLFVWCAVLAFAEALVRAVA